MSGMAILVLCAVGVDPNGWQTDQIPSGPVTADSVVDPAATFVNPTSGVAEGLSAPPAASADWSEIEQALNLPPGQPSRSHAGFPALRSADGASLPPQPTAELGVALPAVSQPPLQGVAANAAVHEAHPLQGLPAPPSTASPSVREQAREVVLEQKLTQGSFSERQYIAPPPREADAVVPVPNRDPRPRTAAKAVELPIANATAAAAQEKEIAAADSAEAPHAEKKWWPLLFTMLGLFASLGFNVYLGWIAFDIHGRYHEIADEIQDLEQKLENGARGQVGETHRERQQNLAS